MLMAAHPAVMGKLTPPAQLTAAGWLCTAVMSLM
jgi:hypothetical protein